jgi:copper chaperone
MSETVTITVAGMKCGGCENNVTAKLNEIDGVLMVKASSKDKEVTVEFDAKKTDLDAMKVAITAAGFVVE